MTPEQPATGSPRSALAGVAERVIAHMPGVALTAGDDDRWMTAERDRRIRGVTSVAQGDGRFELGLHVVVAWPPEPLAQLADDLRRRVHAAAKRATLADRLGEIQIHIAAVQEPDEPAPEGERS